jgi:hypothetical protein
MPLRLRRMWIFVRRRREVSIESNIEPIKAKLSLWESLGKSKDQLTILLALIGIPFIVFQYFQNKLDGRIANSLSYVTRQENKEIIAAKTYMDSFVLLDDGLKELYLKESFFGNVLSSQLKTKINQTASTKSNYYENFYTLQYFYNDVALCTISGSCDKFSACSWFFGQINFFRNNNAYIYTEIDQIFHEGRAFWLDRFIQRCDDRDVLFARVDNSVWCQAWVYFRALAMVDWFTVCHKPP